MNGGADSQPESCGDQPEAAPCDVSSLVQEAGQQPALDREAASNSSRPTPPMIEPVDVEDALPGEVAGSHPHDQTSSAVPSPVEGKDQSVGAVPPSLHAEDPETSRCEVACPHLSSEGIGAEATAAWALEPMESSEGVGATVALMEKPLESSEGARAEATAALREEPLQEPPLVLRCHQWDIKNSCAEKDDKDKGKKNSSGRGRGKGRGRGGRGKKQGSVEPEFIPDSDEEKPQQEECEPPLKKARKTSSPKPKPRGKAKAKAKSSSNEPGTSEPASDAAEDECLDKNETPVVWVHVSKEGVEAINRAYGWDPCTLQDRDRGIDASGGEVSLKRKIEAEVDLTKEKAEPAGEKIKSFARRPIPKSSPARDRWMAIRDCFVENIRPYVVQSNFACSSFEAHVVQTCSLFLGLSNSKAC